MNTLSVCYERDERRVFFGVPDCRNECEPADGDSGPMALRFAGGYPLKRAIRPSAGGGLRFLGVGKERRGTLLDAPQAPVSAGMVEPAMIVAHRAERRP